MPFMITKSVIRAAEHDTNSWRQCPGVLERAYDEQLCVGGRWMGGELAPLQGSGRDVSFCYRKSLNDASCSKYWFGVAENNGDCWCVPIGSDCSNRFDWSTFGAATYRVQRAGIEWLFRTCGAAARSPSSAECNEAVARLTTKSTAGLCNVWPLGVGSPANLQARSNCENTCLVLYRLVALACGGLKPQPTEPMIQWALANQRLLEIYGEFGCVAGSPLLGDNGGDSSRYLYSDLYCISLFGRWLRSIADACSVERPVDATCPKICGEALRDSQLHSNMGSAECFAVMPSILAATQRMPFRQLEASRNATQVLVDYSNPGFEGALSGNVRLNVRTCATTYSWAVQRQEAAATDMPLTSEGNACISAQRVLTSAGSECLVPGSFHAISLIDRFRLQRHCAAGCGKLLRAAARACHDLTGSSKEGRHLLPTPSKVHAIELFGTYACARNGNELPCVLSLPRALAELSASCIVELRLSLHECPRSCEIAVANLDGLGACSSLILEMADRIHELNGRLLLCQASSANLGFRNTDHFAGNASRGCAASLSLLDAAMVEGSCGGMQRFDLAEPSAEEQCLAGCSLLYRRVALECRSQRISGGWHQIYLLSSLLSSRLCARNSTNLCMPQKVVLEAAFDRCGSASRSTAVVASVSEADGLITGCTDSCRERLAAVRAQLGSCFSSAVAALKQAVALSIQPGMVLSVGSQRGSDPQLSLHGALAYGCATSDPPTRDECQSALREWDGMIMLGLCPLVNISALDGEIAQFCFAGCASLFARIYRACTITAPSDIADSRLEALPLMKLLAYGICTWARGRWCMTRFADFSKSLQLLCGSADGCSSLAACRGTVQTLEQDYGVCVGGLMKTHAQAVRLSLLPAVRTLNEQLSEVCVLSALPAVSNCQGVLSVLLLDWKTGWCRVVDSLAFLSYRPDELDDLCSRGCLSRYADVASACSGLQPSDLGPLPSPLVSEVFAALPFLSMQAKHMCSQVAGRFCLPFIRSVMDSLNDTPLRSSICSSIESMPRSCLLPLHEFVSDLLTSTSLNHILTIFHTTRNHVDLLFTDCLVPEMLGSIRQPACEGALGMLAPLHAEGGECFVDSLFSSSIGQVQLAQACRSTCYRSIVRAASACESSEPEQIGRLLLGLSAPSFSSLQALADILCTTGDPPGARSAVPSAEMDMAPRTVGIRPYCFPFYEWVESALDSSCGGNWLQPTLCTEHRTSCCRHSIRLSVPKFASLCQGGK